MPTDKELREMSRRSKDGWLWGSMSDGRRAWIKIRPPQTYMGGYCLDIEVPSRSELGGNFTTVVFDKGEFKRLTERMVHNI